MGKNAEAKQELQTALNLEPNDADAKGALAKLDESPGASAK
jgi:hypothetical protein